MEKLVKEFSGFSGSRIFLMQNDQGYFVRKIGNVERNIERLNALNGIVTVPKIYSVHKDILDMEYIHGLDMYNYLQHNQIIHLEYHLRDTIDSFMHHSVDKNYTDVYNAKLQWVDDCEELPFSRYQLIERLPKVLPQTTYHGDMTLENILHTEIGFVFIDPVTIEYDSYVFDIAKLRQDLECMWFMRRKNLMHDIKLKHMQSRLLHLYPEAADDHLLILMLLRVYRHCEPNTLEHSFILKEVNRLWK